MRWDEFLDCADRYILGTSEGDRRSAVSRAYYGVFHYFREWLRTRGIDVGAGAQAHNSLYVGFYNSGIPAIKMVGDRIDVLRRERTQADYDLWRTLSASGATALVREARDLVIDFQALLTSTPGATIVSGVKKHLISIGRLPKTP